MGLPVIILDRDGVINFDSPSYIKTPEEWVPIAGSLEAIARLKAAGYPVAVATNQSGISRGYFSLETLEEIHRKMEDCLALLGCKLDRIQFCPHGPEDQCDCRKPRAGMYLAIAQEMGVAPNDCIVIGDSMRDLQAGWSVGAHVRLVLTGNGQKTLAQLKASDDVEVFSDLSHAVQALLRAV